MCKSLRGSGVSSGGSTLSCDYSGDTSLAHDDKNFSRPVKPLTKRPTTTNAVTRNKKRRPKPPKDTQGVGAAGLTAAPGSVLLALLGARSFRRSEERRVGKECRSRGAAWR